MVNGKKINLHMEYRGALEKQHVRTVDIQIISYIKIQTKIILDEITRITLIND